MQADELRQWRATTGYSQERAATRFFRVTRATLANWENGATPIPYAVDTACKIWERRVRQETANEGPVTLCYSDGPMYRDLNGPHRPIAMMHWEQYATNAQAIARVLEMTNTGDFYSPFILEGLRHGGGEVLWNANELERIVMGHDREAPTRANLLDRCGEAIIELAKNVRQGPHMLAGNGPTLRLGAEKDAAVRRVEELADELDRLAEMAPAGTATYHQVEEITAALRSVGKYPHSSHVSDVAKAFIDLEALTRT
jgi:DNA-binding XRE family transcriptional regulator